MVRFAPWSKRTHLGVKSHELTVGTKDQSLITRPAVASLHRRPANEKNSKLLRRYRQKLFGFSAISFRNDTFVHAETGGEHLGKCDKRTFSRRGLSQKSPHFFKVGRLVFP